MKLMKHNHLLSWTSLRSIIVLMLFLAGACQGEEPEGNASVEPGAAPSTMPVNGLYNSGFELVADSTTTPAKYGAYWVGAFSKEPGCPDDLIEEDDPYSGERCLGLTPGSGGVLQKIVADPRWTENTRIILALRLKNGASLKATLEDGQDQTVSAVLSYRSSSKNEDGSKIELTGSWTEGRETLEGITITIPDPKESPNWSIVAIDVGRRFFSHHGHRPQPRLNIRLECIGPDESRADIDDIFAAVDWPYPSASDLAAIIAGHVLWTLETWYLPEDRGGLQLVDPQTGFVAASSYHVETGENRKPNLLGNLHTIHDLLVRWILLARERGWEKEVDFWSPYLECFVQTLLARSFDPKTDLPQTVLLEDLKPNEQGPVTVSAFIHFLLKARDSLGEENLKRQCLEKARRVADRLIALQQDHDLPPRKQRNRLKYNEQKQEFEGNWPNWFGHIPDRLTPDGSIENPKQFNTSWAILSGRTFWYHYFRSAAGIMSVHALEPRRPDIVAVNKVLGKYHRDWDATRYDLENDTDDHYGYLGEDLPPIIECGHGRLKKALDLLQEATDHRLAREATEPGETLWIQGVRLGTPCAGDSPRAMAGVLDLYELPPSINPISSGLELYRRSLLELARNDLKGRQLTNGQFTESFFKDWEMVCICYRGSYQGDCRKHPADYWH
ncbi:MAG: hypothetical protein KJ645_08390, partial [Planctomycetes bacterium]|nr:hypothetical protein [Planctomycetota bacterium]